MIAKLLFHVEERVSFHSIALKRRFGSQIFNIHIQDPKVSFNHFDLIISPEHDGIKGKMF